MIQVLSSLFLVAGAGLCLIAAIGVLRLPDFFMRMHAATKAGVAGCGLILIGVAFGEPSVAIWLKVLVAIAFLLLTTPIAGHLIGRAGYVAGVPFWSSTMDDDLKDVLPRGDFDRVNARREEVVSGKINQVVLAVAAGDGFGEAMETSLDIARRHGVRVKALAIIDTEHLHKVGPVPIGGNYYAQQLRRQLTAKARVRAADAIEAFERAAAREGVQFVVALEEGDPERFLRQELGSQTVLVLPRSSWFDHGLASNRIDPSTMLKRYGIGGAERDVDDTGPIVLYV